MSSNNIDLEAMFGKPDNGVKVTSKDGTTAVVGVESSGPGQIDLGAMFGAPDNPVANDKPDYGTRRDGTPKGTGFLGVLQRPDGKVSTELTVGVDMGDGETDIPSLVPTLTELEVNYLLTTNPSPEMWKSEIGQAIMGKAVTHARGRMAEGKSVFAENEVPDQSSLMWSMLDDGFIKPSKSFYSGVLKGAAGDAALADYFAGKVADMMGVPESKPEIFRILRDDWASYSDQLASEGVRAGIAQRLWSGAGGALWAIPQLASMAKVAGPFGMGILSAIKAAPSGPMAMTVAFIHGTLLRGTLNATKYLPLGISIPANAGVFAVDTAAQGGSKEDIITSMWLGAAMSMIGKHPTMKQFLKPYKTAYYANKIIAFNQFRLAIEIKAMAKYNLNAKQAEAFANTYILWQLQRRGGIGKVSIKEVKTATKNLNTTTKPFDPAFMEDLHALFVHISSRGARTTTAKSPIYGKEIEFIKGRPEPVKVPGEKVIAIPEVMGDVLIEPIGTFGQEAFSVFDENTGLLINTFKTKEEAQQGAEAYIEQEYAPEDDSFEFGANKDSGSPEPVAKKKVAKKAPGKKEKNIKTWSGRVSTDGGIDPDSVTSLGYKIKEDFDQFGISPTLKKGGHQMADYAEELIDAGELIPMEGELPAAALLRVLQTKEPYLQATEKEFNKALEEHYKGKETDEYVDDGTDIFGDDTEPASPEEQKLITWKEFEKNPWVEGDGFFMRPTTRAYTKALKNRPDIKSQKEADEFKEKVAKDINKIVDKLDTKLSKELSAGKVKPTITLSTGVRKVVNKIVVNEMTALKIKLKAEAKGSKAGFKAGKSEFKERMRLKKEVERVVKSIISLGNRKLPKEYKEQVDAILEQYDLKKRTNATKEKRMAVADFIKDARKTGDMAYVPKDFFKVLGVKKTLDEMDIAELNQLRIEIKAIVEIGANEGKLIADKEKADFNKRIDHLEKTMLARIGEKPVVIEEGDEIPPYEPADLKSDIDIFKEGIDEYFAGHRKIENMFRVLRIPEVFEIMQGGTNADIKTYEHKMRRFLNAFKHVAEQSESMTTDTIKIPGRKPITRWHAIGVALNSETVGNRERLTRGHGYDRDQIEYIKSKLEPNEIKFVDEMFDLVASMKIPLEDAVEAVTGVKPKMVEEGRFFPISTDYSADKAAQARAAQEDIQSSVYKQNKMEQGFLENRKGGSAPLNLDVLPVIMKYMKDTIHYASYIKPLRDTQKIINDPRFKAAFIKALNKASYDELNTWLSDIVNPRGLMPRNVFEYGASWGKNRATGAILGYKASVSILQALSATQAVSLIGADNLAKGIAEYYRDIDKATIFIYANAPEMKHRRGSFDRDLVDWLKTSEAKNLLKGMPPGAGSALFEWIRAIDMVTVNPIWLGAYGKMMEETGDKVLSKEYAMSVVRRSQPMGTNKDLPRVMRGTPFMKLFTMFKTFYVSMHNMLVDIRDEYRFQDDNVARGEKGAQGMGKAARAFFWVYVLPSLLSSFLRSGGTANAKDYGKGLLTYPVSGILMVSDIANAIASGYGLGSPGLKIASDIYRSATAKTPGKKALYAGKVVLTVKGNAPVDSLATFGEGLYGMIAEKSWDVRKLVYSKSVLDKNKEPEEESNSTLLNKFS